MNSRLPLLWRSEQLDRFRKYEIGILVSQQRDVRWSKIHPDNQSGRPSVFQMRQVLRVDKEAQLTFTGTLNSGNAEYFDGAVTAEIAIQSRRYVAQFHIKSLEFAKLCRWQSQSPFVTVSQIVAGGLIHLNSAQIPQFLKPTSLS